MDNDIDRILNSIDNISPASPSEFFYNGIIKKMNPQSRNIWEQWSAFIAQPAVLVAGCFLIVILNLASIIISAKHQQAGQQTEVSHEEDEQLISRNTYDYLDFENSTP